MAWLPMHVIVSNGATFYAGSVQIGGGGGRAGMARAGGKDATKLPEALQAAAEAILGAL